MSIVRGRLDQLKGPNWGQGALTRNVTFVKGIGEGVKLGLLSSYFEPTGQIFTANIIGQFFLSSGIPLPT